MLLIPSIDLKDGQCVCTEDERDAAAVADRWVEAGARRLHIADLDGAESGIANAEAIREIVARHPDLELQVAGALRDEDGVEAWLSAGADYVILGPRAFGTPHFVRDLCIEFAGHVIVGLDARDGKIATDGWSKLAHHDVVEVAQRFERDGVAAVLLTDLDYDEKRNGVNAEAAAALAREIAIPVIAAGGIASLDDIRSLCAARDDGVMGAVIGRALYEGDLDLGEAQQLVGSLSA
ncbi:MAG TPA: HisA/HisF-related TIM barrel protein [Gammaproteobacteria bacterium]|nr:HisA/HisF-related TIM barrel protein [Gammaproteobacteria bacterium]